jgi:hypothetical protein
MSGATSNRIPREQDSGRIERHAGGDAARPRPRPRGAGEAFVKVSGV